MNQITPEPLTGELVDIDGVQAILLPEGVRFDGGRVAVARQGDEVVISPLREDFAQWVERMAGSFDEGFARAVLDGRPGPDDMPEDPRLD